MPITRPLPATTSPVSPATAPSSIVTEAMGHRLSKIVTRTGDTGTTGLTGGGRVPKTHARVQAMGEIDELNSQLGVLLAQELPPDMRKTLTRLQHELFDLGGELSMPGAAVISAKQLPPVQKHHQALKKKDARR